MTGGVLANLNALEGHSCLIDKEEAANEEGSTGAAQSREERECGEDSPGGESTSSAHKHQESESHHEL